MIDHNLTVTIERVIRKELGNSCVKKVDVKEETDFNGDTVYNIAVTLDAAHRPSIKKMAGLVRHVRSEIEGQSDYFPIFRFLSNAEVRGGKIAAT